MSRKCALKKPQDLQYIHVTEETLEIAEGFCNGSIKGTKLPRKDRVIKFWANSRDEELEAPVGYYIVKFHPGILEVYPPEMFHKLFKDIDHVPY